MSRVKVCIALFLFASLLIAVFVYLYCLLTSGEKRKSFKWLVIQLELKVNTASEIIYL